MSAIDPTAAKEIRKSRRAFAAGPLSAFVRTMQRVITQYLNARAQGVTREHGIRGIEEALRAAWPKSVSKFSPECPSCEDTGWREMACWEGHRCGRETCAKNPERQHPYVVPCGCVKGDRLRAKVWQPEDQIAAAGKTQKAKRGWRQVGA